MKEVDDLSEFALQRAQRLEGVLGRIRQSDVVELKKPTSEYVATVKWTTPEGVKSTVTLTDVFVRGLSKVAVTLYKDLKTEGEEVLAADLVDQHRAELCGLTEMYGRKKTEK